MARGGLARWSETKLFGTIKNLSRIIVSEEDGNPTLLNINKLKFPSGTVTDNGDGSASITGIGGGTMDNFKIIDGDSTEVSITNAKYIKFTEGGGIDVNWTDRSSGTSNDPYDLTFTVDPTLPSQVDSAGDDFILIADTSDSSNLKKARLGYAWDGSSFYVDGKIGIGVESPTYALDIPNSSNAGGYARANAFITYSSRGLKKNINKIEDPLILLDGLRGVTFEWRDTNRKEIGLIAEEVQDVLPEIVVCDKNKPVALDYSKLTALLIECVKEQQGQINDIKEEIKKLINY